MEVERLRSQAGLDALDASAIGMEAELRVVAYYRPLLLSLLAAASELKERGL